MCPGLGCIGREEREGRGGEGLGVGSGPAHFTIVWTHTSYMVETFKNNIIVTLTETTPCMYMLFELHVPLTKTAV